MVSLFLSFVADFFPSLPPSLPPSLLLQEDYPLERPEVIQDYLAYSTPPATNFIYCWDLRGHDFFGQWEHHQGRVSRVFIDLFNGKSREVEGMSRPPPKVKIRGGRKKRKIRRNYHLHRQ